MGEWWNSLTPLNQGFYVAAAFFSVFFLWQLISALMGLGGEGADVDEIDVAEDFEPAAEADAAEATAAFRLFSIRSVISFCTLFTWGGALYLDWDESPGAAIGYAVLWGLGGMFAVAVILYGLRRLTQRGTSDIRTSVGKRGNVYLDIPEGGIGEVRVPVSGVLSHVRARASDGKELKAGKRVRVVDVLDQTTVEVETIQEEKE